MLHFRIALLFSALSCVSSFVNAESATGIFIATQKCPMYQSKNHKTNPDSIRSVIAQRYDVVEYLGSIEQPDWVRVNRKQTPSPYRWIDAKCGTVNLKSIPDPTSDGSKNASCHTPNTFDSHVLALSWQPGFCTSQGKSKPECIALNKGNGGPTASEFSLHGLWPNKTSCGKNYNFCGKYAHQPFPDVTLSNDIETKLNEMMPSTRYNQSLENHEWWKHGTCRDHSPNDYFDLATTLVNKINESSFVTDFIRSNIGKTVSTDQLNSAFDNTFGTGEHKFIALKCNANQLIGNRH